MDFVRRYWLWGVVAVVGWYLFRRTASGASLLGTGASSFASTPEQAANKQQSLVQSLLSNPLGFFSPSQATLGSAAIPTDSPPTAR
jgi:hypothetical protein